MKFARLASLMCAIAWGPPKPTKPNVLVVLLDEVGIDKFARYGIGADAPSTPNLDALADEGVLFRNAYVTPSCSPTRAALLTERTGRRTGVGEIIHTRTDLWSMPYSELTIPEMLTYSPTRYATSLVGKWHLVAFDGRSDVPENPLLQGFEWFAGSLANLNSDTDFAGKRGYYDWEKVTQGTLTTSTTYATTDTVDDAIDRVATMREPWFLEVAFNAAHIPLDEAPPIDLDGGMPQTTDAEKFDSAVVAMDTELGRLLDSLPEDVRRRTTIIALGDNGTPPEAIVPPMDPDHGKGTVWELGVRAPLIVAGPLVASPGAECDALVSVLDVFPTVAELAGVDLGGLPDPVGGRLVQNGLSLVPYLEQPDRASLRDVLVSDHFGPNGPGPHEDEETGARDYTYKLMIDDAPPVMYRLGADGLETGEDLLASPLSDEATGGYLKLLAGWSPPVAFR